MAFFIDDAMDVGSSGYKDGGYSSPYEYAVGIDGDPAFIVLMLIVVILKDSPSFFKRYQFHAVENSIGNLRSAIRKAFTFPLRV